MERLIFMTCLAYLKKDAFFVIIKKESEKSDNGMILQRKIS